MRPRLRQIAAASAAAYLLAGWLAAALHSHGAPADELAEAAANCSGCSCGHPSRETEEGAPAAPAEHEHCHVCQFLANPPHAAAPVSLVAVPEPVTPAVFPIAPTNEIVRATAWWSRGPPA